MNALYSGSIWPFIVLAWPLLVGLAPALPRWRSQALRLLPMAPLPALGFALAGAPGNTSVPDLVLGVELAAAPGGALLLGVTAVIWIVAGWSAALTLRPGPEAGILAGFWCLTLAGNLGVFLAADIVTFYLAFAAVSLSAWFLVVHERTGAALAAGRVYIVLAMIGETALLLGLMIGAAAADDLQIATVRAAMSEAPLGQLGLALMVLAFGIKAGMAPLHVWLPLAHPAAPVPGSAVLSGAIVKAGLIGLVQFLPESAGWGALLIGAGLAGAFGGALWGLTQRNPKAVLAYSTVSQMGVMLALLGAGSGKVALVAAHHGLAKAALFLAVGAMAAAGSGLRRRVTLAVAGVTALSMAGLPLTGGALAKLAGKASMEGAVALAVTLSSIATTLVLAWFLHCLTQPKGDTKAEGESPLTPSWSRLCTGVLVLAALALVMPWQLWRSETGLPAGYPLRAAALIDGFWPILLGLAFFALVRRRPVSERPPGDLLNLRPGWPKWPTAQWRPVFAAEPTGLRRALWSPLRIKRAEKRLQRWPVAGLLMVGTALALTWLLRTPQ